MYHAVDNLSHTHLSYYNIPVKYVETTWVFVQISVYWTIKRSYNRFFFVEKTELCFLLVLSKKNISRWILWKSTPLSLEIKITLQTSIQLLDRAVRFQQEIIDPPRSYLEISSVEIATTLTVIISLIMPCFNSMLASLVVVLDCAYNSPNWYYCLGLHRLCCSYLFICWYFWKYMTHHYRYLVYYLTLLVSFFRPLEFLHWALGSQ